MEELAGRWVVEGLRGRERNRSASHTGPGLALEQGHMYGPSLLCADRMEQMCLQEAGGFQAWPDLGSESQRVTRGKPPRPVSSSLTCHLNRFQSDDRSLQPAHLPQRRPLLQLTGWSWEPLQAPGPRVSTSALPCASTLLCLRQNAL